MAFIYDLADTWNNGATTFTAIKMNVTDSASSASSLLMDLQVGGSSKLLLRKDGLMQGAGPANGSFNIGSTTLFRSGSIAIGLNTGPFPHVGSTGGGGFTVNSIGNSAISGWNDGGFLVTSGSAFGWTSGTIANNIDTALYRDAADTLAQRRGVNAQTSRIYNTYTDASNYERGFMQWSSNTLTIGAEAAGTGTQRSLQMNMVGSGTRIFGSGSNIIFSAGGNSLVAIRGADTSLGLGATQPLVWTTAAGTPAGTADTGLIRSAAGVVVVTNASTGGGALEFREQTAPAAPAANQVRIYAEDNGLGKTRLMALFATGVAIPIATEL